MITSVGVVIPVANEEELLPGCLEAMCAAVDELRSVRDLTVRTIVVLDTCDDASGAIAAGFAVETISVRHGQVGGARQAGTRHLLRTLKHHDQLWIASSDADSCVPHDWLSGMVELADSGVDLVLGTVRPAPDLDHRVTDAWYARHVLDDGHPHIHGANLGIRADVYRRAGGWPGLASGEDEALAARVGSLDGVRIARTSRFPVATSARLAARAPHGFSRYLDTLSAISATSLDGESA